MFSFRQLSLKRNPSKCLCDAGTQLQKPFCRFSKVMYLTLWGNKPTTIYYNVCNAHNAHTVGAGAKVQNPFCSFSSQTCNALPQMIICRINKLQHRSQVEVACKEVKWKNANFLKSKRHQFLKTQPQIIWKILWIYCDCNRLKKMQILMAESTNFAATVIASNIIIIIITRPTAGKV